MLKLYSQLPIEYDYINNELLINLPKDLKIRFLNNIDIITENDFNVLSLNEINLCSVNHDINIDSLNSAIYLNSQKAKQIKNIPQIITINQENNHFTKKKELLINLNKCLNQIIGNIFLPK